MELAYECVYNQERLEFKERIKEIIDEGFYEGTNFNKEVKQNI